MFKSYTYHHHLYLIVLGLLLTFPESMAAQSLLQNKEATAGEKNNTEQTPITFETPPPIPRPKPTFKVWTSQEIKKAAQTCEAVLKKWDLTAKRLPAIASFDGCGDPAPLLVSQVFTKRDGKTVPVSITPPATLNCKMTDNIAHWLNNDVQKTAVNLYAQPVIKIHNVASYHCRRRNNALVGKMSEHAFANALDIASFSLEDGTKISLLKHWQKASQNKPAIEIDEKPKTLLKPIQENVAQPLVKISAPEHKESVESIFLKTIHKSACALFSTVLGPEANKAHADHFHLDLGRDGRYQICE